jgi:beta-galactosidase
MCGEYWAGWFDHWGEMRERLNDAVQIADLEWMLAQNVPVNVYMFHGGTNYGFWNGANSSAERPYQPTTTSYDYEAALDEAGRPTQKYYAFRDVIARVTGRAPIAVPPVPRTRGIAAFALDEIAPIASALRDPLQFRDAPHMEAAAQYYGYALYRTRVSGMAQAQLAFEEVRDYAVVAVDGTVVAHLDRRLGETHAELAFSRDGSILDILIENGGRINYGPELPFERKGLTKPVRLNGEILRGWEFFRLPPVDPQGLEFAKFRRSSPAFYRGFFEIDEPADTFLDVESLGKGCLWVNGRNAGRFWNIGPQRVLYVPAAWLRPGSNCVVAFDLFEHASPPNLRGRADR